MKKYLEKQKNMQIGTIKNKIMNKYRLYSFMIILVSFILYFFSCNKTSNVLPVTELLLDTVTSNITDNRFPLKKIDIINNIENSIFIDRFYGNYTFRSAFLKIKNNYFEIRKKGNKADIELGTDTILTFTFKDTVYIYNSEVDFTPTVFDFALADCKYVIKEMNNNYITIKQSLVDTTYKEIYFYDKNYNIYKYINTWKDNKCVYVVKRSSN